MEPGGRLNFQIFETDRIDDCVEFMKHLRDNQLALNGSKPGELCVMATGGGAYKFYDKIRDALGVDVLREDEMECLIIGEELTRSTVFVATPRLTSWFCNRSRFLHHGDSPGGLYVLRDRSYALCDSEGKDISLSFGQHWVWGFHPESRWPSILPTSWRHLAWRGYVMGIAVITDGRSKL